MALADVRKASVLARAQCSRVARNSISGHRSSINPEIDPGRGQIGQVAPAIH